MDANVFRLCERVGKDIARIAKALENIADHGITTREHTIEDDGRSLV